MEVTGNSVITGAVVTLAKAFDYTNAYVGANGSVITWEQGELANKFSVTQAINGVGTLKGTTEILDYVDASSTVSGIVQTSIVSEILGRPEGLVKMNGVVQTRGAGLIAVRAKGVSNAKVVIASSFSVKPSITGLSKVSGVAIIYPNSEVLGQVYSTSNITGVAILKNNVSFTEKIGKGVLHGTGVLTGISSRMADSQNRINCTGEAHLSGKYQIIYTQKSAEGYPMIEKRVLFGPDTLGYIQSPDELY